MEAAFATQLPMAMALERLTSGRGKELATQETMIWYEDTAPMGICEVLLAVRSWKTRRSAPAKTYEEHGEVASSHDGGACDDGIAGHSEHHEHTDVDTAVTCGTGRPSDGDGDEERCEPDCEAD